MAKLTNQVPSDKIIEWYSKKMRSDDSSVNIQDALYAFFFCAFNETFSNPEVTQDERGHYLMASMSVDGKNVSFSISLHPQYEHINCIAEGPDQEVSLASAKLLEKADNPKRVSGDAVFSENDTADDDRNYDSSSLTESDMLILLPARWFALSFWAIFGFLLWIPILVRSHIFASMAMAVSALSGKRKDNLYRLIRYANTFWIRGFHNISSFGADKPSEDNTDIIASLMMLVMEACFAAIFYAFIFMFYQHGWGVIAEIRAL